MRVSILLPTHWLRQIVFGLLALLPAAASVSVADELVAKLVLPRSPLDLDPYSYLSLPEWYVHHNITATLVELDHENQIVPGVAKSFRVSDQGKTYRFVLSADTRWSDGSRITPSEVLASFRSPERHKNAQLFPKLLKVGSLEQAVFLENENTLVIRLAADVPGFLFQLATPEYGIVDVAALEKTKRLTKETRTSGDYRIAQLEKEMLRLEVKPGNKRLARNNPQKIEFRFVTDQNAVLALIKKGELDFFESQSDDILQAARSNGKYRIVNGGMDNLATLQARNLTSEQWQAVRVLAKFLDRERFIKPPKQSAAQVVALSTVPARKERDRISVLEARRMLGNRKMKLELSLGEEATPDQLADAEVLRGEAAKIGVELLVTSGIQGFRKRWEKEDYALSLVRMGVYAENEAELLHGYFCTGFEPYKSLEKIVCGDINQATSAGTPPEKVRLHLRNAYDHLRDSGRIIPLYHFPRRFLVAKRWQLRNHNPLVPFPRFSSFFGGKL